MTRTLISIVTPSYNQAEFIEETIVSVSQQSYSNVEHFIIDGESTDGTLDLLHKYDDEIQWISEPDEGQSDAINKGFDMASGSIIGWLNSDDVYFDRNVFTRVRDYFDQNNVDIIYGDIALIDHVSDLLKFHCVPKFDYDRLLRGCFIEQPALFFRSTVLKRHRLEIDLEYVMDYEFWLRLGREYKFRHVDDVLAGDRNHAARKILNKREQMQAEAREIAKQYGAATGWQYRAGQLRDVFASGAPRRIEAIKRTIQMHRDPPELAFDGQLCPPTKMLRNVFRPNRTLV